MIELYDDSEENLELLRSINDKVYKWNFIMNTIFFNKRHELRKDYYVIPFLALTWWILILWNYIGIVLKLNKKF
jgi:hypothetical protein